MRAVQSPTNQVLRLRPYYAMSASVYFNEDNKGPIMAKKPQANAEVSGKLTKTF